MKLIHGLALIPFVMILGGVCFVNKVEPYILGMPFLLAWLVFWVIMTSVIMAIIYKIDPSNREEEAN